MSPAPPPHRVVRVRASWIGLALSAWMPAVAIAQAPPEPAPTPAASGVPAAPTSPAVPAPGAAASTVKPGGDGPPMTMEAFLDRLMIAESGGRLEARNPRSTALGPFQFIEGTFLAVARRHFAAETAHLTPVQVLALRTDMAFSRRAAEAYTRDNAAILQSQDVAPTWPNLRLAFLLGAGGAVRVLKAPPDAPLAGLLAPAVLVANPFMASLTARGLAARSAREVALPLTTGHGVTVPPGTPVPPGAAPRRMLPPGISIRCNLRLPSCKRWLALIGAKARAGAKAPPAASAAGPVATVARGGKRQPSTKVAALRGPVRVSPTMEAAARGIPLASRPALRAAPRTPSRKSRAKALARR